MYHCTKLKISDLNPHIMCVLCGGYFIDATTIIECLHSFCRTCIVRYLESSKFCPICDVQVHKTRPLLNIRSDKTLQDLVYKLVPGLFQEEMRRRREFLSQHPEVRTAGMDLEQRGLAHLVPAHSLPEERISLVLELATPGSSLGHELQKHSACSKKYLLCPSDVSMGHLKKFLRIKFALSEKYQIDVFYRQSEETISDDFTLLDVTFIYSWNRKKPLRLLYSIYEKPRRKRKLAAARFHNSRTCQTKKARLEKEAKGGASPTPLLHSSSAAPALPSRHSLVSSGPKATANGLPAAKRNRFSGALSQNRTKKKVLKAKAALKSHPVGGKIKLKPKSRLSFDRGGKGGRGRRKVKATKRVPDQGRVRRESHNSTPGSGPVSSRHSAKPNGNARSGTKLPASNAQPDTKLSSTAGPGFRKSSDSITHGAKPAPPNRNGSATSTSPTLHASFYRKVASTTTTTLLNGRAKPWAKTAQLKQSKSRSSSPKLSTPGSSRSASPKLLGVVSRGSRCSSPRPATGKDSPRPSSRGSSRTGSPRPADLQRARPGNGAVPPSLPVEEKISVDVTMAASSSETSSDVTSPGAEDRANSTGLEEPGDFDGGGHVCNLAAFAPRPLPSLAQLPGSGAGQSKAAGKGSQTRESAKTAKPSQTLTRADSRTPNNNKKR